MKRYLRSRAQIIASLGQPLLYLLVLGFGLGPVFQQAGQGSYLQFVAPGVIGMAVLFTSIFSGIGLLWDRQFGFLKETLVAPVPRLQIMIGRTLGGATVAMMQGTARARRLPARRLPARRSCAAVPLAFLFMALIAIVFAALGTAIGSTLKDMQGFQLIMNFLVMPIFFLSGALFPLTNLPTALTIATRLDPLTYGVDGLRGALIGVSHFGAVDESERPGSVATVFLSSAPTPSQRFRSDRGLEQRLLNARVWASMGSVTFPTCQFILADRRSSTSWLAMVHSEIRPRPLAQ